MKKYDKRKDYPAFARTYLSEMRKNKELSIETVALTVGVSASYYFLIEGGYRGEKMTVILLSKLVDALSVSAEAIVNAEVKYQNERSMFLKKHTELKTKQI